MHKCTAYNPTLTYIIYVNNYVNHVKLFYTHYHNCRPTVDKDMRDFVSDLNSVESNSESNSVERNFDSNSNSTSDNSRIQFTTERDVITGGMTFTSAMFVRCYTYDVIHQVALANRSWKIVFPGTTISHVDRFKSMARVKSESESPRSGVRVESQAVQISDSSRVAATRVNLTPSGWRLFQSEQAGSLAPVTAANENPGGVLLPTVELRDKNG